MSLCMIVPDLRAKQSNAVLGLPHFVKEDISLLEGINGVFVTSFVAPAPFAHPAFKKGKRKSLPLGECTVSRYVERFVYKQSAPFKKKVLEAVGDFRRPLFVDVSFQPKTLQ